MRVVVIGGTGHIGTYLIPRLVEAGHDVVCVTRKRQQPYLPDKAWEFVERILLDREQEDSAGRFGAQILALHPDVVMDLICFSLESASQLVESLRHQIQLLIHCGTIWVHGPSIQVPTTEEQLRRPFGSYGIQKVAIEKFLLTEARLNHFPVVVLHPGHIVGQGWIPLNPAGNFNLDVYKNLANGKGICLPNLGLETVHHVHADDVAQAFMKAMNNHGTAVGESFHVVSSAALTLRGYAEAVASWFGHTANMTFLPWNEWRTTVSEEDANNTWDHISHSPNCSIAKAQRLIDYQPRYSSLQAVKESIGFLMEKGLLKLK
jgi:nucleoside-diphosphate-sugar epimerase